jgi:hypothetical protein
MKDDLFFDKKDKKSVQNYDAFISRCGSSSGRNSALFPVKLVKMVSEIADTSKYVVGGHTAILILCSYIQGL